MKRILCSVLMAALLIMLLQGCAEKESQVSNDADAEYASDYKIVVHGLQANDFEIGVADLAKLARVTQDAEATRANGEKINVTASGALLDDFLKVYGKNQKDYSQIRFTARDGYSIAVPASILAVRPIMLSYINDGKPLKDEDKPIRIVIPGERAMYWVRNLERIDLEIETSQSECKKIIFLESAANCLATQEYKYYESVDKAFLVSDLVGKYMPGAGPGNVLLDAVDGLHKNETSANFNRAYIKFSGQDAPLFGSPDLPQGMQVKEILSFSYGKYAGVSIRSACKKEKNVTYSGQTGVAFSSLMKSTGLAAGMTYIFKNLSGDALQLNSVQLGNALIFMDSDGEPGFLYEKNGKTESFNNLLSIEAVQP